MVTFPSFFQRVFSGYITCRIPKAEKILFLTFDDGPTPDISDFILESLRQFNAYATFFCVGQNIQRHPDVFQKCITLGHSIGNHTYSHKNGWKTSNIEYFRDIEKFNEIFKTKLFRPPYGRLKLSQLRHLNRMFDIYLWSVLSYDFDNNISADICLKNIIRYSDNGSIIVFHDNVKAIKNLSYALPRVLQHFSEKGFKFNAIL